jgi:FMN phosphatase YigB (HAD superfamily)
MTENGRGYSLHLKANPDLVMKITQMKKYRHFILTNSSTKLVKKSLKELGFVSKSGLPFYPFEKIFSRDVTLTLKPNSQALSTVLRYTNNPACSHLVIGDSYRDDIEPANKLRCQTADIGFFWEKIWPLLTD